MKGHAIVFGKGSRIEDTAKKKKEEKPRQQTKPIKL